MNSSSQSSHPESRFLHILLDVQQKAATEKITLEHLIELFGEKSHQLMIFFIALPFMQPIPLIGLSTPLGGLMVIISFFDRLQMKPWIPKSWRQKQIPSDVISKSTEVAVKIVTKMEKLIHPRWVFMKQHPIFGWINFVIVSVSAILLALPLPIPFSNTVPNLVIITNAVGQLEDDGLVILISYGMFVLNLFFFAGLFIGAGAGIDVLMKNYF